MVNQAANLSTRAPLIDAVRGISILAIIAYHVIQRWPFEVSRSVSILSSFGSYGVDVFFALSGFLVGIATASGFGNHGSPYHLRQLLNRLLRVYLPYLVALIVVFAGISVLKPSPFHLAFLFLVQNYLIDIPFFLISWFLCILFYYYVLAFLLLKIPGNTALASSLVMLALALGCVALRLFVLMSGQLSEAQPFGYYFTATHLRSDSIALAFALGLVFQRLRSSSHMLKHRTLFLVLLISFCVVPLAISHLYSFDSKYLLSPFFAALFSTLLAAYCYVDPVRLGSLGIFRILSTLSVPAFSLYLTHSIALEVATIVHRRILLSEPLLLALLMVLIGAFGALFFFIIEKPSKKLSLRLAHSVLTS